MRKRKASTSSRDASKGKRMSEELKVSGNEFHAWFNLLPDFVAIVDEKGKILAVNDAAEKVGGFKRKEFVGKNFLTADILTSKSKAVTVKNLAKRMIGARIRPYEIELVTRDGEKKWGEVSATKIEYKGRPANLAVFRDITERKKMEEELRESEERYRTLIDDAPIGILNVDLEGTITFINKKIEEVSGYSRKEVVGKSGFELGMFDDETLKILAERMRAILEGETPRLLETRFKSKDGRWIWVEMQGRAIKEQEVPVGLQLIASDITERKRADETLKHSQAKLKALHRHARTLAVANSIEEVAKHTLDAMEFTLGFDIADFCLVQKGYVHVKGSRGIHVSPILITSPLDGPGVVVKSVNEKRTLRIPDTRKEPAFVDRRSFSTSEDFQPMLSELVVPVLTDGEAAAVLNVESSRLNAFTDEDQELLETLAMHVASALGRLKQVDTLERTVELRASELKASEEKYRRLVDNMTDVVFSIDLKGNFTFCSQAAEKMTGYSVQQLLSMNMKELIAPEHFPEIQERLQARIRGERYLPPHQFEIIRADGKRIPVEMTTTPAVERGTLTGIQGIARDISERRKAESDLKESEEKFRRIYNASLNAIYTTSISGEILDMNPAGFSMFGFDTLDELRKVNIKSLYVNPDDRKRLIELAAKGPVKNFDVFFRRKDGATINCIINCYALKDEEGRIAKLQGAIIDITELGQMEKKLREAERLAAIGETTAMVGHDLRNPLTGITGAVYILKTISNMKKDSKAKEFLDLIERNVECSNKIISDLLDYSAELHLNLTATNPKSIIADALRFIPIPENTHVTDLSRNDTQLIADAEKLRRVAVNLITNAVDAMPEGGTLTISAGQSNGDVEIAFSDTGTGMTKETMENLWTPLFTTKAKGMGFGLPIVRRIVEAHGGSIFVESIVGKGSTFKVKLPIKPELKEVNRT